MPIRRSADPSNIQHVWDAIRSAVLQHQMADTKRITKYLQRVDKCTVPQAELYVQQAASDGMIVALPKVTGKGEHVDSFRIPTQEQPELDGKDWYCFECHLGGDVTPCRKCFRVFHPDCITSGRRKFDEFKKTNALSGQINPKDFQTSSNSINISSDGDQSLDSLSTYKTPLNNNETNGGGQSSAEEPNEFPDRFDDTLCTLCNISKTDNSASLDKSELNYLLKFVIHRIQAWLPNTITHTMAEEDRPEWLTDRELTWRANQLFFEHRDMSVIEVNLNNESYTQIHQFLADVLTIQHNVAIFHGIESQEYGAAELMVRDCIHDLAELKICVDCYRHSNEKMNSKWFCLPCRVPHRLVWAKQKGYPYWPAKVIRETSTHFDVRFFGGKYERSLLAKAYIKPIEIPKEKLQIKPSSAFNKSVEELRFHQKLLRNPAELQRLIESSRQKMRSLAKRITPLVAPKPNSSVAELGKTSSSDSSDVYQFDDSCTHSTPLRLERHKRKNIADGDSEKKKRASTSIDEKYPNPKSTSDNVIDISDGDDEHSELFSFRDNTLGDLEYNNTYEQVSSSTENYRNPDAVGGSQENGMQQLDHPYSDSVEKMRRKLECLVEKKDIIRCAMDCMQGEVDRITNDHNDHLKRLFESHNAQISETKKKQWCYNCEQDAIYHCCWNTAYCSQSCQQQHWQAEHKKVCRRKR